MDDEFGNGKEYTGPVTELQLYCRDVINRLGYGEVPDTEAQRRLWTNTKRHPRSKLIIMVLTCAWCGEEIKRTVGPQYRKRKYTKRVFCNKACAAFYRNKQQPQKKEN